MRSYAEQESNTCFPVFTCVGLYPQASYSDLVFVLVYGQTESVVFLSMILNSHVPERTMHVISLHTPVMTDIFN